MERQLPESRAEDKKPVCTAKEPTTAQNTCKHETLDERPLFSMCLHTDRYDAAYTISGNVWIQSKEERLRKLHQHFFHQAPTEMSGFI